MGHSRHYALRLTERDFTLFRYLFITKGAARWQIHRDIFQRTSRQVVHERLRKLSKYGFISGFPAWFEGSKTAYHLTPRAANNNRLFEVDLKKYELKSPHPNHELALIEVRNRFLKTKGLIHYLTENQLQADLFDDKYFHYKPFIKLNSDAFLRIKFGEDEFSGAVEFEQSRKSKDRYINLFLEYYQTKYVAFVFYVVDSSSLLSYILQLDKKIRGNQDAKIFGITYFGGIEKFQKVYCS